jgi:phage repressor protein C with HTH and peptisase S24 domain
MRSAASAPAATATYSLLLADLPGEDPKAIGVLLTDPASDLAYIRLRRDWEEFAEAEDAEVLMALGSDLDHKAREFGAEGLLQYLEQNASLVLQVTDRQPVEVTDFEWTLNRLYRQHVQTNVVPFRTHLPLQSLRVAAGEFLANEAVSQEGWVEAPEDLKLGPGMFVARIVGHSMEPLIPDGSLCVFRHDVIGSRQGRLVLVEDRSATGDNRYTVKRYKSEKVSPKAEGDEFDESWRHGRIRLESLNPDYPSWDLVQDEEKYAIIAEFVRVLE